MAKVTIIINGKPTQVEETRPGLFGELGYQYAGGGATTQPTPPPQDNSAEIARIKAEADKLQQQVNEAQNAGYGATDQINYDTGGSIIPHTGNQVFDHALELMQNYLSQLNQTGQVINPNIVIDSAKATELLNQATANVDPYFKSQINAIKDDLTKSLDYAVKRYEAKQAEIGETFRRNLGTQRETEAGAGTIFSGGRNLREQQLGELTSKTLSENAAIAAENARDMLTQTEKQIGTSNIGANLPSFKNYLVSTQGKGSLINSGSLTPSLTGGVTGSIEYDRKKAIDEQNRLLREAFINQQLSQ